MTYFDSSAPLKYECTISWKATANGIVSAIPMVKGDGPLETPTGTHAVRNSKLFILSARLMLFCVIFDASDRREGGRGIDMNPEVGVGVCLGGCLEAGC